MTPIETVPRPTGQRGPGAGRPAPVVRRHGQADSPDREALIRQFMPLARKLARRYGHTSEPYEDLLQVASLALVKAVDRFDPERGVSFHSFAIPTILGELRRHFRDSTWAVRVTRGAQERAVMIADATERLTDLHGRPPTVPQLAVYLEMSTQDVTDGLLARNAYATQSLEAATRTADDGAFTLGDTLGAEDDGYALVEARMVAADALRLLPLRERRILHLRFVHELTQSEIAAQVGVSQMQISRILRRSLDRLRELAGTQES